jgi:putative transposase
MLEAEKAIFSLAMMCKQVGVSRSGYYAWKKRTPSKRQKQNKELLMHIEQAHKESHGTYGSPRVLKDIKELGFVVGRNRVARLMHAHGITGQAPPRFRRTTDSKHTLPIADNVLERKFEVDGPDKVWAADITYIRTWEGWLYLAVVIDLFSRRVVGWSMATHLRTDLILDALKMALGRRLPGPGMLHHSDRGSQYASHNYRNTLKAHGITCSMSRKGNCWDNAVVESFFGTLKTELIYRRPWPSIKMARTGVAEYIEVFYNRKRRHSYVGYVSPVEFEKQFAKKDGIAA